MAATIGTPRALTLSAALRVARESANVGVRELARRLSISHTQISLWEHGHRVPKLEDTAMILAALRVEPEDRERILDLARKLDEPNWLTTGIAGLPQKLAGLAECDRAASSRVEWAPMSVPGLLQTSDYARAMMTAAGLSSCEAEKRVMVRINRREVLTTRDDPLKFESLISEAVLHEPLDSDDIMADQLRHMIEMTKRPNVTIRVIPLHIGWHPGWSGPFVL